MNRWLIRCLVVLALSAIYLYGFPSPTLTYEGGVVVHLGAGIVLSVLLARYFLRLMRSAEVAARVGWAILALGGAMGLALIFIGGSNRFRAWLYVHIALCVVGTVVLAASWVWSRGWLGSGVVPRAAGFAGLLLLVAGLARRSRKSVSASSGRPCARRKAASWNNTRESWWSARLRNSAASSNRWL